ncbi:MAG: MBL fold metallo-hydrolase [Arachnia propionica]|uniref:MBL fold metallo-hydrolase n=1 Tax=Arachnia propionica TaxID=1750 RepID=UPI002700CFDE|nr:MBL fold metallo-hydrolase [Arachnia propionica]
MSITHLVTHAPDQPEFTNNVWLVGDNSRVIVIDPAHDPTTIAEAIAGREVTAILLTHGHWDHITAAPEFARLVGQPPIHLNPADGFLWSEVHGDAPFQPLRDGDRFTVADVTLRALATPGHTPGSTCLATDGVVFTGDTLFEGGPGATRWEYSDFSAIIISIRERLLPLPDETLIHTGHGPSTSVGAEKPHVAEWMARGW